MSKVTSTTSASAVTRTGSESIDVTRRALGIGVEQPDDADRPHQAVGLIHDVDGHQRLRLDVFGQADTAQGLVDAGVCRGGEEVHAHDPAGAGGVESEQGQDLGPGAGRKQVEDLLPAALWQLGDGVGGVVGSHVGDDLGHLGVGLVPEQPGGDVGVQLFEHVSFQFGVGMDHVEDLFALGAGGVLQKIGDLGRLELDDPPESGPSPDAGGMADQRLEGLPVLTGMSRRWTGSARTIGPVVGCPGTTGPSPRPWPPLDVPGPHQFGFGDVDEPVAQDVLSEQDLAVSPLEAAQVDLGLRAG